MYNKSLNHLKKIDEGPRDTEPAAEEIKDVEGTKKTLAVDSLKQLKPSDENNSKQ